MPKFVRNISLYLAALMLLLHNLTPHQHHGAISSATHNQEHSSSDVFDFLRSVLHNDLGGQRHLETIQANKSETSYIQHQLYPEKPATTQQPDLFGDSPVCILAAAITAPSLYAAPWLLTYPQPLEHHFNYTQSRNTTFVFTNIGLRAPPSLA